MSSYNCKYRIELLFAIDEKCFLGLTQNFYCTQVFCITSTAQNAETAICDWISQNGCFKNVAVIPFLSSSTHVNHVHFVSTIRRGALASSAHDRAI